MTVPTIPERKAHVLAAVDLRKLLGNSGASFKSHRDSERVRCPLCGAGGFGTGKSKSGARVWKCHGGSCGGGNAIDFVMARDRVDFIAALEALERDHGGLAGFSPERREELARRRAAAEERAGRDEARRREAALARLTDTLARMVPVTHDTLAWKYLEDRGLDMAMLAPCLRPGMLGFVPDARHPDDRPGRTRPALIARVTRPENDVLKTVALQAIFLDPVPQVAPAAHRTIYANMGPRPGRGIHTRIWRPRALDNAKIATGFWNGGACRLFAAPALPSGASAGGPPGPRESGGGTLGLAEGIEKALAVTQLYGVPCWAAMYAANFETCLVDPREAASLALYVDNNAPRVDPRTGEIRDPGGVSFEAACARRESETRAVNIYRPPVAEDFSDTLVLYRAGFVGTDGALRCPRVEAARALEGAA